MFASTTTTTICICCKKLSQTKKCKKVAQNNNLQVLGKKWFCKKLIRTQQKIQIVQNKEAKVNREVKVNKEAKDKDIKEAEDKLNMGTEKDNNGEKVKLSEERRDLKENMEKIHKVDDTNGVRHRPTRTSPWPT